MDVLLEQVLSDATKRNTQSAEQVVYNVTSAEPW